MSVLLTHAKTAAFALMRTEDIDAIAPLHTLEQNAKQKKVSSCCRHTNCVKRFKILLIRLGWA